MKAMVLTFLVFGVGFGVLSWMVTDYIARLKRQIAYLEGRIQELQARNDDLVLALEARADAARIDEAIRRGRVSG